MIFMRRHETEENQENVDLGKLLDGDEELEDGGHEARRVADHEGDHHDDGRARELCVPLLHLALVDPSHPAHALARAQARGGSQALVCVRASSHWRATSSDRPSVE